MDKVRDAIIRAALAAVSAPPTITDEMLSTATRAFVDHYGWQHSEWSSWREGVHTALRAALGGEGKP